MAKTDVLDKEEEIKGKKPSSTPTPKFQTLNSIKKSEYDYLERHPYSQFIQTLLKIDDLAALLSDYVVGQRIDNKRKRNKSFSPIALYYREFKDKELHDAVRTDIEKIYQYGSSWKHAGDETYLAFIDLIEDQIMTITGASKDAAVYEQNLLTNGLVEADNAMDKAGKSLPNTGRIETINDLVYEKKRDVLERVFSPASYDVNMESLDEDSINFSEKFGRKKKSVTQLLQFIQKHAGENAVKDLIKNFPEGKESENAYLISEAAKKTAEEKIRPDLISRLNNALTNNDVELLSSPAPAVLETPSPQEPEIIEAEKGAIVTETSESESSAPEEIEKAQQPEDKSSEEPIEQDRSSDPEPDTKTDKQPLKDDKAAEEEKESVKPKLTEPEDTSTEKVNDGATEIQEEEEKEIDPETSKEDKKEKSFIETLEEDIQAAEKGDLDLGKVNQLVNMHLQESIQAALNENAEKEGKEIDAYFSNSLGVAEDKLKKTIAKYNNDNKDDDNNIFKNYKDENIGVIITSAWALFYKEHVIEGGKTPGVAFQEMVNFLNKFDPEKEKEKQLAEGKLNLSDDQKLSIAKTQLGKLHANALIGEDSKKQEDEHKEFVEKIIKKVNAVKEEYIAFIKPLEEKYGKDGIPEKLSDEEKKKEEELSREFTKWRRTVDLTKNPFNFQYMQHIGFDLDGLASNGFEDDKQLLTLVPEGKVPNFILPSLLMPDLQELQQNVFQWHFGNLIQGLLQEKQSLEHSIQSKESQKNDLEDPSGNNAKQRLKGNMLEQEAKVFNNEIKLNATPHKQIRENIHALAKLVYEDAKQEVPASYLAKALKEKKIPLALDTYQSYIQSAYLSAYYKYQISVDPNKDIRDFARLISTKVDAIKDAGPGSDAEKSFFESLEKASKRRDAELDDAIEQKTSDIATKNELAKTFAKDVAKINSEIETATKRISEIDFILEGDQLFRQLQAGAKKQEDLTDDEQLKMQAFSNIHERSRNETTALFDTRSLKIEEIGNYVGKTENEKQKIQEQVNNILNKIENNDDFDFMKQQQPGSPKVNPVKEGLKYTLMFIARFDKALFKEILNEYQQDTKEFGDIKPLAYFGNTLKRVVQNLGVDGQQGDPNTINRALELMKDSKSAKDPEVSKDMPATEPKASNEQSKYKVEHNTIIQSYIAENPAEEYPEGDPVKIEIADVLPIIEKVIDENKNLRSHDLAIVVAKKIIKQKPEANGKIIQISASSRQIPETLKKKEISHQNINYFLKTETDKGFKSQFRFEIKRLREEISDLVKQQEKLVNELNEKTKNDDDFKELLERQGALIQYIQSFSDERGNVDPQKVPQTSPEGASQDIQDVYSEYKKTQNSNLLKATVQKYKSAFSKYKKAKKLDTSKKIDKHIDSEATLANSLALIIQDKDNTTLDALEKKFKLLGRDQLFKAVLYDLSIKEKNALPKSIRNKSGYERYMLALKHWAKPDQQDSFIELLTKSLNEFDQKIIASAQYEGNRIQGIVKILSEKITATQDEIKAKQIEKGYLSDKLLEIDKKLKPYERRFGILNNVISWSNDDYADFLKGIKAIDGRAFNYAAHDKEDELYGLSQTVKQKLFPVLLAPELKPEDKKALEENIGLIMSILGPVELKKTLDRVEHAKENGFSDPLMIIKKRAEQAIDELDAQTMMNRQMQRIAGEEELRAKEDNVLQTESKKKRTRKPQPKKTEPKEEKKADAKSKVEERDADTEDKPKKKGNKLLWLSALAIALAVDHQTLNLTESFIQNIMQSDFGEIIGNTSDAIGSSINDAWENRPSWMFNEVAAPEIEIGTPEAEVETPEPAVETPEPEVETPEAEVETPEAEIETPETEVETPEPEVETPETEVETPELAAETPEPAVETPEPAVETPEPEVETPEPEVETPEAEIETPETEVETPEAEVETPEPAAELKVADQMAQDFGSAANGLTREEYLQAMDQYVQELIAQGRNPDYIADELNRKSGELLGIFPKP